MARIDIIKEKKVPELSFHKYTDAVLARLATLSILSELDHMCAFTQFNVTKAGALMEAATTVTHHTSTLASYKTEEGSPLPKVGKSLCSIISALQEAFDEEEDFTELEEDEFNQVISILKEKAKAVENTLSNLVDSYHHETTTSEQVSIEQASDEKNIAEELETILDAPDLPSFIHERMNIMKDTLDEVTKKYSKLVKPLSGKDQHQIIKVPVMVVTEPFIKPAYLDRVSFDHSPLVDSAYIFYDQYVLGISNKLVTEEGGLKSKSFNEFVSTLRDSISGLMGKRLTIVNDKEPFRSKGDSTGQVFYWLLADNDIRKLGSVRFKYVNFPFTIPLSMNNVFTKDLKRERTEMEDYLKIELADEIKAIEELESRVRIDSSKLEDLNMASSRARLNLELYTNEFKTGISKPGRAPMKPAVLQSLIESTKNTISEQEAEIGVLNSKLKVIKATLAEKRKAFKAEHERLKEAFINRNAL